MFELYCISCAFTFPFLLLISRAKFAGCYVKVSLDFLGSHLLSEVCRHISHKVKRVRSRTRKNIKIRLLLKCVLLDLNIIIKPNPELLPCHAIHFICALKCSRVAYPNKPCTLFSIYSYNPPLYLNHLLHLLEIPPSIYDFNSLKINGTITTQAFQNTLTLSSAAHGNFHNPNKLPIVSCIMIQILRSATE